MQNSKIIMNTTDCNFLHNVCLLDSPSSFCPNGLCLATYPQALTGHYISMHNEHYEKHHQYWCKEVQI
jgi:hypothetical protein